MTQSLIVFAALQVASLAIILACTALESLRTGTERFRGERPAKAKTGLARGARRKQRHGANPPRGLTWWREAAAPARRRAVCDKSHRRSSRTRGGPASARDTHNANP